MDDNTQVSPTKIRMPLGAIIAYSILTILSLIAIGGLHTFAKYIAPDYTIPPYPSAAHRAIGLGIHLLFLAWAIYHPVRIWRRSSTAASTCLWAVAASSILTIITTPYAHVMTVMLFYGFLFALAIAIVAYVSRSKKIERWKEYKNAIIRQRPAVKSEIAKEPQTPCGAIVAEIAHAQQRKVQSDRKPNAIVRAWDYIMQPQLSYPIFIFALVLVVYFFFVRNCYDVTTFNSRLNTGVIVGRIISSILLLISFVSFGKNHKAK